MLKKGPLSGPFFTNQFPCGVVSDQKVYGKYFYIDIFGFLCGKYCLKNIFH